MMFNARRLKMNRSAFSALFVAAALAGNLHNATGQMINPTVQTASTACRGEPQRASDGGKACCDRTCGAADRSAGQQV